MTKIILNYWRYMKIPEVDYHLSKIDCDKLTFNYIEYPTPFHILDKFRENIEEYDYIVMVTNDVIVKQEHVDQLIRDIEILDNPSIVCGAFNVDLNENAMKINVSKTLDYDWMSIISKGIEKVKFAGLPLMAIRKDIFKRYEWTGSHFAGDLRFCKWLDKNDIPIYCNTDNRMLHLRYYGEKPINEVQSVEWKRNI